MYLVLTTNSLSGDRIGKYESLDEVKEAVKALVAAGKRDVIIAQEIPMKLKVEAEF